MIIRSHLSRTLALAMLATAVAYAQATPEVVLRQLAQDAAAAADQGDWQFFDQLMAPEWTAIDDIGQRIDKVMVLNTVKALNGKIARHSQVSDVEVRFLKDDVAVVTAQITVTVDPSRKAPTVKVVRRTTDIYVQRQGKWMVVASQLTPVQGG
jgi:uncharacterized protein (TIGR02246 family)